MTCTESEKVILYNGFGYFSCATFIVFRTAQSGCKFCSSGNINKNNFRFYDNWNNWKVNNANEDPIHW